MGPATLPARTATKRTDALPCSIVKAYVPSSERLRRSAPEPPPRHGMPKLRKMDTPQSPRRGYSSLTVHRDRGVLWVCDISRSSSFMNSDDLAEHIEAFLPRLHWVSSLAIHAIHGELIQWTGDGFIAWFPLEVERQLGRTCNRILEAI